MPVLNYQTLLTLAMGVSLGRLDDVARRVVRSRAAGELSAEEAIALTEVVERRRGRATWQRQGRVDGRQSSPPRT